MANSEENINKDKNENRNINIEQNSPEILTNPIYTPAFLREQIGRLMRVEFLIGTNNMVDRIGILEDVGASYILLRSFENDSLVYCDIYSINPAPDRAAALEAFGPGFGWRTVPHLTGYGDSAELFITISTTGFYGSINNMNSMNNMGTPNRFNYF